VREPTSYVEFNKACRSICKAATLSGYERRSLQKGISYYCVW